MTLFCLKKQSILKSRQFAAVFQNGRVFRGNMFTFFVLPSNEKKIGFAVKKNGLKAVNRNRIKRLERELWRVHSSTLRCSAQIVVLAGESLLDVSFNKMDSEFSAGIKRIEMALNQSVLEQSK
ncbi:ribonuclease P protein component [candidate division KSB1 bacterium]|nr:ribonuclease P protein component [candidate division KSB1 bacterium]